MFQPKGEDCPSLAATQSPGLLKSEIKYATPKAFSADPSGAIPYDGALDTSKTFLFSANCPKAKFALIAKIATLK